MQDLAVQNSSNLSLISGQDFNNQLIWLWLHRFKSRHTKRAYTHDVGLFLTFIGDRPLSTATHADLQGFENSLASSRLAPATINRKLHALRSLLTFGAEKVRMLPTNVGVVLESQKVKDDLAQRILSEEQVFKMFALEADPRNLQILRFLYYTGCRVSEVCSLKWRDLQPSSDGEGQVTVYGKGGKTRVVLLPEKVWRSIQDLKGKAAISDPVFVSAKCGHLDPSQVFRIVQAAAARAGIEGNVSPHWLRHSHASHSMDRGAPLHVVQASLGHSNPATTGRYLHAHPGDGSGRYLG